MGGYVQSLTQKGHTMPANAVAVTDAERIRWETVEQLLEVESIILSIVREQSCVLGVDMTGLYQWITTEKGNETAFQAIELLLENYNHRNN